MELIKEHEAITNDEIRAFVAEAMAPVEADGQRVLFVIPDQMARMPMPVMFRALHAR